MMRDAGLDTPSRHAPDAATDALGNVLPRAAHADIGLLLEGTYPYVSGGVSSWVHDVIRAFPDYTFALCFLGSTPDEYTQMSYPLPANVVHLENHYLYEPDVEPAPIRGVPGNRDAFEHVAQLHAQFRQPSGVPLDNMMIRHVVDDLTSSTSSARHSSFTAPRRGRFSRSNTACTAATRRFPTTSGPCA